MPRAGIRVVPKHVPIQQFRALAVGRGAIVLCATHDHSVIQRADSVIELVADAAERAA